MPNHTTNILTVTGNKTLINKMIKSIQGVCDGEQSYIDFRKIKPRPKALEDTVFPLPRATELGIELITKNGGKIDKNLTKLEQVQTGEADIHAAKVVLNNIKKYGAADWYNWSVYNWGTKWNAYDTSEWEDCKDGKVTSFYTAWSPPIPVIKKLSSKYPTLTFKLEYADEGGGFLGFSTFDGLEIEEVEYGWNSKKGIELREKMGLYYPEDEE